MERPKRKLPSLYSVAKYWTEHRERFPEYEAFYIGLGEPFCCGCGFLAPIVDDYQNHPDHTVAQLWSMAGRYIDRAHLADRFYNGLDDVQNLVPLCWRCHRVMPSFQTGEPALRWVQERRAAVRANDYESTLVWYLSMVDLIGESRADIDVLADQLRLAITR